MVWHRRTWLIDHGAAFYFHHRWDGDPAGAADPFARIREHVLLPAATRLVEVDADLARRLDEARFRAILAAVPDDWLAAPGAHGDPAQQRAAYVQYLTRRLALRAHFVEEACRVR